MEAKRPLKLNEIKCDFLFGIIIKISTISTIPFIYSRNITDNGRTEFEVFNRAKMAAATTQTPLMVHHTNSNINLAPSETSLVSCPGSLKKGSNEYWRKDDNDSVTK